MNKCVKCPHAGKYAFCNLGAGARDFLDNQSVTLEYPRGSILFREGERGAAIFLVCSGKVKVSASSSEGRSAIVRVAHHSDVLGMSAVLGETEYEVTAEALEPCMVRVLHARALKQFMAEFRDATIGVAQALAQDYKAAFQEIRRIALPETPAGRLSRLILDWAEEHAAIGSSSFVINLTHEELASMTSTTRETITRTLSRLRKDNVITTKGVSFTILNPAMLHQLAAS
ncbi:Crp/Fnr family transcriptional regulator [Terriglobus sp. ADX1]|uniref:Crp/Fnr family transcriptional regulator n=1 Tax=Terriglobus sp. ADX1 TaxID=2794063 RepID=UPI002FE6396A